MFQTRLTRVIKIIIHIKSLCHHSNAYNKSPKIFFNGDNHYVITGNLLVTLCHVKYVRQPAIIAVMRLMYWRDVYDVLDLFGK
jgi:hypothetical protein